ncbi:MAG: UDP-N-acetylglucosamine--N-acetylmuramyl-(pentapeptide) pyrophosphoryl-undecaprenol N-acetylglucosamine transferase [Planctomycetes bacterium]|nr:UDP-N-acetylglucosamine--N-acetylmuramyl-(pentapeptide) pyrophosphoryl-undecaprenol N-acetylglucosamine transferase [Planctomycetota bacterium]
MVARVGLVSSGTGGHLWPALVLGRALRERGHQVCLFTEGRSVERALLQRDGFPAVVVDTHRAGPLRLLRRAFDARRLLREHGIGTLACTGGRTSLVVGLAAASLRIPLVVLEQNAVTGRANRILGRFARRIYLGLPNPGLLHQGVGARAMLVGTPLRPEIGSVDRHHARAYLGIPEDATVVMVTGGSQGAGVLNLRVPEALVALRRPLHVLHLSGPDNERAVKEIYHRGLDHGLEAWVRPLALDMHRLYAAADLVVARGGGCTVAELAASGRAALIVPYPHHRDRQQYHNARVLEEAGAARIVEQAELTVERLRTELTELLRDPDELRRMGERARDAAPANACASIVADLQRELIDAGREPAERGDAPAPAAEGSC